MDESDEEQKLRAVARETSQSIFLARKLAEEELLRTKAALELQALELTTALELAHATLAERDRARAEVDDARLAAVAANEAKSRFLSMISHELRTPLGAIGGYIALMEEGISGALSDQHRDFVARIRHNQTHLLRLVDELLDLAKIESGRVVLNMGRVDMRSTIEQVRPMIEPQIQARGLQLDIEPIDRSLLVHADPERVQQIVLNLLSNAAKFTGNGTSISIATAAEPDRISLRVRDNGIGIASDKLEAVFEPFVQASTPTSGAFRGTGLGLTISRQLARAMGGDLIAESTLYEGSTFTLSLLRA
ncbi:MAG: HAMP domain-containing sensor histidine kinase [bacterium]